MVALGEHVLCCSLVLLSQVAQNDEWPTESNHRRQNRGQGGQLWWVIFKESTCINHPADPWTAEPRITALLAQAPARQSAGLPPSLWLPGCNAPSGHSAAIASFMRFEVRPGRVVVVVVGRWGDGRGLDTTVLELGRLSSPRGLYEGAIKRLWGASKSL